MMKRARRIAACTSVSNEDHDAIRRWRDGDAEAFVELVERHQATVYNIARRLLGNDDEAQDTAQDAFVRALEALPGFRGESSFRTWICRIVTRLCFDQLRSRRRWPLPLLESDCALPSSEHEILARAVLEKAIGDLAPMYRAAVILRHVEQLSYEDISRVLNMPLGTVKSHIRRARQQLRMKLGADFGLPDKGETR
jgi:RNA polymerase sigma-70 factor (ECF subfamily)